MTESSATRAYAVRLACGDGWKNAMPMAAFATLLNKKNKGATYDSAKISRIESGGRTFTIEDARAYAVVDPQRRGAAWLAMLDEPAPARDDTFGLQRSPGRTVDEALADFTPESSRAIGGKKRGKG